MDELCLKWNNHSSEFDRLLNKLYLKESYSDGTLVCHGQFFHIHRFVLSMCSEYFEEIFNKSIQMKCQHPFIIVKDVQPEQVKALLNYMYKGEVSIQQDLLPELLIAAEAFKIKGLAAQDGNDNYDFSSGKNKKRSSSSSPIVNAKRSKRIEEKNKISSQGSEILMDENFQPLPSPVTNLVLNSGLQACDDVKTEPSEPLEFIEESHEFSHQGENSVLFSSEDSFLKEDHSQNSWNQYSENASNPLTNTAQTLSWDAYHDQVKKKDEDPSYNTVDLCKDSIVEGKADDIWESSDLCQHNSSTVIQGLEDGPMYFCNSCPFQCKKKCNMKRHVVTKHAEDKPFKCTFCPYQCATEDYLKTHIRKHTGEKPFTCPHCPYRATQNVHLQAHLKTHTGEKPFHCVLCPFKASLKYRFNFHMKKHLSQINNMA